MSVRGRYTILQSTHWTRADLQGAGSAARLLYLFLYAHPRMTSLGILQALRESIEPEFGAMAGESKAATSKAWDAIAERRLISYDAAAGGLLILPDRLLEDHPPNPNVVKSWGPILAAVPQSKLLDLWLWEVKTIVEPRGKAFADAFKPLIPRGKPPRNGFINGSTNRKGKAMPKTRETIQATDAEIRIPNPESREESAKALPASGPRERFGAIQRALQSRGFEGVKVEVATILAKAKAWERADLHFADLVAEIQHVRLETAEEPFVYLLGVLEQNIAKATGRSKPQGAGRGKPRRIDNGANEETLALRAAQLELEEART